MVKRTNLPRSGTTSDVGGMISASKRKNTVSDNKIEMDRLTCDRTAEKKGLFHTRVQSHYLYRIHSHRYRPKSYPGAKRY